MSASASLRRVISQVQRIHTFRRHCMCSTCCVRTIRRSRMGWKLPFTWCASNGGFLLVAHDRPLKPSNPPYL